MSEHNKIISKSFDKIDGKGAVLGKPMYVQDLAPNECLYVKLLRSPYAFAEIVSINTDKALQLDGVECILTYKDVKPILHTIAAEAYPEGSPYDRILLGKTVRYVGDPVAVIAAESEKIALKAMELIEVEYEVKEPILDLEKSIDNEIVIHEPEDVFTNLEIDSDPARNIAAAFFKKYGNVENEFEKCDCVIEEVYHTPAQAHAMLETHRAFSYLDTRDRIVIVTSAQSPFHVQRIVANLLEIPQNKIRVIKPKIGGAFGGKNSTFIEPFVALVTQRTKKPCMLIFTREECFACTNTRHEMRIEVKMGANNNGIIKAIEMNVISNTGAYGEHCIDVLAVGCKNTMPIYSKIKAVQYDGKAVYTNKVSGGAYRGFGGAQTNFALESAVNEITHRLNLDPVEVRLKNIIREGETHPFLSGGTDEEHAMIVSSTLEKCILKGKELIGWDEKYPKRIVDKNKIRAVGMSIAMHGSGIAGMDVVEAEVRFNYDGTYTVLSGASDLGTGGDTILLQMAGEVLQTSIENIDILAADTATTPYDKGAYASSTTYVSGNAVMRAAKKLRKKMIQGAGIIFEVEEKDVEFDGKYFETVDGSKRMSIKDFSTKMRYFKYSDKTFKGDTMIELSASSRYGGPTSPPPFVAGFVEVEVDNETGKTKLLNYVAIADCGTVINPKLARIQVEGGIVQGIGYAIYEYVCYSKNGRLITDSFMQYKIPSSMDLPNMQVGFEESYEPTGPFGAKSLGEVVFHTPSSAIQDAIFNAVGARIRDLPITSEKVLKAIKENLKQGGDNGHDN